MPHSIKQTVGDLLADRVIRCRRTYRYLHQGAWTDDPRLADTFPDEIQAVRTCLEHNLKDVELVLRTPGTTAELFSTRIR